MDFFHCNVCYSQPGPPKNRKYSLTSCGHSICSGCINPDVPVCNLCKTPCQFLPLTKSLPEAVRIYFTDQVEEMKQYIKISQLQLNMCRMYIEEYSPRLEAKYLSAKEDAERKNKKINEYENQLVQLNAEMDKLKIEVKRYQQETGKSAGFQDKAQIDFHSRASRRSHDFRPRASQTLFITPSPSIRSLDRHSPKQANLFLQKSRVSPSAVYSHKPDPLFTMRKGSPVDKSIRDDSPNSWCSLSSTNSMKTPRQVPRKKNSPFTRIPTPRNDLF